MHEIVVVVCMRWTFMVQLLSTVVFCVRMVSVCGVNWCVVLVLWFMSVSTDEVEAHLEYIVSLIVISETFFLLLCVDVAQFLASLGMFYAHLFWK